MGEFKAAFLNLKREGNAGLVQVILLNVQSLYGLVNVLIMYGAYAPFRITVMMFVGLMTSVCQCKKTV